ncbi:MAG: hypothetical protein J6O41_00240 [Clostridia bacterium]|nr:hypothetical protein [Clostridia bacterium]
MDLSELKETDAWRLYEQGKNYLRRTNAYTDTDKNYRMYGGNQWEGAKIEGIEQAQYNFIETIVNHKVSVLNQNLWQINYSSENFENQEFRKTAEDTCRLLNKKASKVWEKDQIDYLIRELSDDACINDEGIWYVTYDEKNQSPVNELLNKTDVHYGNENSSNIQSQPYIIISQRKSVIEIQEIARELGINEEKIKSINGDNDYFEEAGESSKIEKDSKCTLVTKFWKEKGKVFYSQSTRYVDIKEKEDSGLSYYPLSHFIWKSKKGSSRGEGEVRYLIPNQLELNKTLARMLLSVKQNAYPTKVVNIDKINNPSAINKIGGVIKAKGGATIDDVHKIFTTISPQNMSTDVGKTISDLLGITRDLKNASNIATGGVNPEQASGKAILAVQQAAQQPIVKQLTNLKMCVEEIARIWLDMWITYTSDTLKLEKDIKDENGIETTKIVDIPISVLENLKADVKVDITPKSPFDKYARELSLENLFKNGFFNAQKLNELKIYAKILPDDSTMPKQDILKAIELEEEEQRKIAEINSKAQLMKMRANQFLNNEPETQASQINEAMTEVPTE